MQKVDQHARKKGIRTDEIDRKHTLQIKQFVSTYGWLTVFLVGAEASHAAWLLVQHADHDVTFQEYCLDLMKPHMHTGEVQREEYAFLYDRVCVNRGQRQLFGTQFTRNRETRELVPRDIEAVESLDIRRRAYGLGPFEAYRMKMNQSEKNYTQV